MTLYNAMMLWGNNFWCNNDAAIALSVIFLAAQLELASGRPLIPAFFHTHNDFINHNMKEMGGH